jgi:tRNA modification GTPase
LTSVEGLADLINAETDKQRQQALFFATGGTRHKVDEWRESLVQIAAIFAALIDFSDEGDVGNFTLIEDAKEGLIRLRNEMEGALVDEQQAEIVRDGYSVAIVGPPNAGKSSLLNALIKRDAAIVSAVPGTTRDIIEVTLDLNGVAVTLIDTAGLREVDDPVEAIGIERARASVRRADLVLWLCSAECLVLPTEISDDCSAVVMVANKCDLIGGADRDAAWTYISALTGFGIHGVLASIAKHASRAVKKDTPVFLGNARQAALIRGSVQELIFAESSMGELEIAAEAIRRVLNLLEEVLGGVDVETVLGRVFSRFCIGK